MNKLLYNYRFLISRRIFQTGFLFLFIGGNYFGWQLLTGNYSSAWIMAKLNLSDPFAVIQVLFSGFIVASDALLGALIVLVFYSFVAGRAFCSWICPLNIVVDLATWLKSKFRIKSIETNTKSIRHLRYYLLVLTLILSSILGFAVFEMLSPIGFLHRNIVFGFGTGIMAVVAVFLFDLFAKPLSFCFHLCPLGAFYSFVSHFRVLKVNHIVDNCTKCNLCFTVCPEKQVLGIIGNSTGKIQSGECTNCGRCIEVCEDKALKFKIL